MNFRQLHHAPATSRTPNTIPVSDFTFPLMMASNWNKAQRYWQRYVRWSNRRERGHYETALEGHVELLAIRDAELLDNGVVEPPENCCASPY
jgi:hypothetical protein